MFICDIMFTMNLKEQGLNAEAVFHGKVISEASRSVYGESVSLFSKIIHSELRAGEYSLADLGSHKGELLDDLLKVLPEYTFKTIAIDVNADDLKSNNANQKIVSDLSRLQLADKSVDVVIARYALAWNDLENQEDILREIKRVTKKIAIVQHQGAKSENPEELQSASKHLFDGIIPQLKRDKFFFSTPEQIEGIMRGLEINFEKIEEEYVKGLASLLIEKYNLSEDHAFKVKEILKNSDYVIKATWILRF